MQGLSKMMAVLAAAGFLFVAVPRDGVVTAAPMPEQQTLASEPLAIVVNLMNAVDDLSLSELRKIFLGERSQWPNGHRITLVMRQPGEPERATVLKTIYEMNESEYNNHFLQGVFTGEVFVSPKTLATPEGVRKFISYVPSSIGYLRVSDVDKTVKVIRVGERLPDDRGYALRVPVRSR
jgi:ABC-type phosphate transport system substrate-binding protein